VRCWRLSPGLQTGIRTHTNMPVFPGIAVWAHFWEINHLAGENSSPFLPMSCRIS
jgi:hypothetical protein